MKFKPTLLLITLLTFQSSSAEEWRDALPSESKALIDKLLTWEEERRKEFEGERVAYEQDIIEKRKVVDDLLKKQLIKQSAGSPEAQSIQALITQMQATPVPEPLTFQKPLNPEVLRDLSSPELFAQIVPKLRAESHGFNQTDGRSGQAIYIAIDGKQIYTSDSGGLHFIAFDGSEIIDSYVAPGGTDQAEEYSEKLINKIEALPDGILVVLGVSDTADRYGPFIKKIANEIGGRASSLEWRQSYLCIGYPGLRRGGAIEPDSGIAEDEAAIYTGEALQVPKPVP